MESATNLEESTIEELKDLVKANANSAKIFREAAETTERSELSQLFSSIAASRRAHASALQEALSISGQFEEAEPGLTAPLRTWWMKARNAVQSDEEVGMLSELESAEDRILNAYKDALKETAGSPLNSELHKQVSEVKADHDRIRDLRDRAKARS